MESDEKSAPGLRYKNGRPLWRASRPAIAAGYQIKSISLAMYADNEALMRERCIRLQSEMMQWLRGVEAKAAEFDGTFAGLFDLYQNDPKSSYHKLKRSSRKPYDVYIRMMRVEIGHCHLDQTDGRDVEDWFAAWSAPEKEGDQPMIAKGRMAIAALKAALTVGIVCRKPGCAEFKAILSSRKFKIVQPRTATMTAGQVTAAREAARAAGHPGAALAYALQFEGAMRQWDVTGEWWPLSDPRPSAIHSKGRKWIGPTWANVDQNMILRYRPSKTDGTTGAEAAIDLRACPMVLEELQKAPPSPGNGPLIVDLKTGLPYQGQKFLEAWRAAAKAAGIPPNVWNRDLRASATTEARAAHSPAQMDDLKKVMGHSAATKVTARVYDRADVEAFRRVAAVRKIQRDEK